MKIKNKERENNPEEAYREYIRIQREEMLGELNRYFASLRLKREATESEAAMHYILFGGAENFNKRYGHLICILPQNKKL